MITLRPEQFRRQSHLNVKYLFICLIMHQRNETVDWVPKIYLMFKFSGVTIGRVCDLNILYRSCGNFSCAAITLFL